MSREDVKKFLKEIRTNQKLFELVSNVATANDIALIAESFGFQFTAQELRSISNQDIHGVKIKKQDTTPSYNFGEEGI